MKLISCYIENFGGLSGYALDFEDGLTVIREPNGFGKTTLAEFIRTMFYGFPRKSRTGLGRKEKYQPWNGGKYGGNLTFEHEGKRYRIERGFGARETFALIDLQTGKKSTAFSKNIGQELFGLDADSFERSTYLPQERQTGAIATDSIRAKLAGLVEDTGDVGNYQKALDALDKKRKLYVHKIGTGGAVAEDIRQISNTQTLLSRARESRNALDGVTARIGELEGEKEKLDGELTGLRTAIAAANEAAARRVHQHNYARLEESHRLADREREDLLARFPKGVPTERETGAIGAAVEELAALEARQITTAADAAARRYVDEHSRRFGSGVPTEAEFDAMRALCGDRAQAVTALSGCVMTDADALAEAQRFLAPGIPAGETLTGHEAALEKAKELRRQNMELAAAPVEQVKAKKNPAVPAALILGLVLAVVGILLLSGGNFAPGGVLLGLGVLVLLAAAYLSLRSTARTVPGLAPEIQSLMYSNEERAKTMEAEVRRFTSAYYPGDPAEALRLIRARMADLNVLTERQARLEEKRRELKDRIGACDQKLKQFFLRYGMAYTGDPRDLLEALRRDCDGWHSARAQLADLDTRQEAHRKAAAAVRQQLDAFYARYGVMPRSREEAQSLRDRVRRLDALAGDIENLERQIADYRRDHGDALAQPVTDGEDPRALADRERGLIARLNDIGNQLPSLRLQEKNLRADAESIPELEDQLVRWQEQKEADEKSAALLGDVMAFLGQARENLATAYMGPIRDSFAGLMERMMDEGREKILITESLDVRLEREGESRELAYFSAGQTDMVRLCMRLALVDALFRETKPFVILDDPFVNLDDERMQDALALLQDLSRDRQIIYLVCNSSRV